MIPKLCDCDHYNILQLFGDQWTGLFYNVYDLVCDKSNCVIIILSSIKQKHHYSCFTPEVCLLKQSAEINVLFLYPSLMDGI